MKYELAERCQRVKELYESALCKRYKVYLIKNNPHATADDVAGAEAAERCACSACDNELQKLTKDIDKGIREAGVTSSNSCMSHILAVFISFACTSDYSEYVGGGGAHP